MAMWLLQLYIIISTLQGVYLCKSFNPAWSSKVFYIKLITNSMILIESSIGFVGNQSALSVCALETNRK